MSASSRQEPKRGTRQCATRAAVFRGWLLETYGDSFLRAGSGILDVGAGAGELAFQLHNLNDLPVIALDPRPLQVDMFARKFRSGAYLRGEQGIIPTRQECNDFLSCRLSVPRHIRMFMERDMGIDPMRLKLDLPHAVQGASTSDVAMTEHQRESEHVANVEAAIVKASKRALAAEWTNEGLREMEHEFSEPVSNIRVMKNASCSTCPGLPAKHSTDGCKANRFACDRGEVFPEHEYGEANISDCTSIRMAMWDCSLVVGLYPDQAIDALVDFALSSDKLFAAVPCCVYASQFPHRRLPNGQPVLRYEDLIQYVVAMDPTRIEVAELPFEGPKNKIVFIRPSSCGFGS